MSRLNPAAAERAIKSGVRQALRSVGYEIRPIDAAFQELQRDLLRECDLVVDVGANVGQYMTSIRSLGYGGPAVSFEPERDAFAALSAAAAADPLWDVRSLALADHAGYATLHVSGNSVSSSLLPMRPAHLDAAPLSIPVGPQDVSLSTVDAELAAAGGDRIWMKLDVQGMELPVLHGATETLTRTHVVQAELSLVPLYDGQTDYLELLGFLGGKGFVVAHILPGFRDRRTKRLLQFDALFVSDAA